MSETKNTWWHVNKHGIAIEPVSVVKETGKSLMIQATGYRGDTYTNRVAKQSAYSRYFPAWQDAYDYLLRRQEWRLESCRKALADAQAKYGNIKGMKPPKDAS